jgi:transcriptional regulator with XRE-family HTH domain
MNDLKRIRKELGWTQARMAQALQISRPALSDMERGYYEPSPRDIMAARWVQYEANQDADTGA